MNRRAQQLASTLDRAVRAVLARGLQDPRVRGLVTVTGVHVGEDLREAVVSVSILPQEYEELTVHGLEGAAAHIRHEVSELVEVRKVPTLRFRLDRSLKKEAAVLAAINRAAAERGVAPGGAARAEGPEP